MIFHAFSKYIPVLKKIGAVLFTIPILFTYYTAVRNNWNGGMGDIAFVLVYITVFSFGAPIIFLIGAWKMYNGQSKGDRYVMIGSLLGLLFILLTSCVEFADPGIFCSEETCAEEAKTNAAVQGIGYVMPMLVPAGWFVLTLLIACLPRRQIAVTND